MKKKEGFSFAPNFEANNDNRYQSKCIKATIACSVFIFDINICVLNRTTVSSC